jgi:DNA-directed RNA polymerase subunit L
MLKGWHLGSCYSLRSHQSKIFILSTIVSIVKPIVILHQDEVSFNMDTYTHTYTNSLKNAMHDIIAFQFIPDVDNVAVKGIHSVESNTKLKVDYLCDCTLSPTRHMFLYAYVFSMFFFSYRT